MRDLSGIRHVISLWFLVFFKNRTDLRNELTELEGCLSDKESEIYDSRLDAFKSKVDAGWCKGEVGLHEEFQKELDRVG